MRLMISSTLMILAVACGVSEADAPVTSSSSVGSLPEADRQAADGPGDEAVTGATEAPATAETSDPPFLLEGRRSWGAMFRYQLSVSSAGRLIWVGQVMRGNTGTMRTTTFELAPDEVRAVREAIDGGDFFSLPARPGPSSIADGTH